MSPRAIFGGVQEGQKSKMVQMKKIIPKFTYNDAINTEELA